MNYIYDYTTEEITEEFNGWEPSLFSNYTPRKVYEDETVIEYEFDDQPCLGYNIRKRAK